MKFSWLFVGLGALCLGSHGASAGPVQGFDCVASASSCSSSSSIASTNLGASTYQYVAAAGYRAPGDGGGGEFEKIGPCSTTSTTGSVTIGTSYKITGVGTSVTLIPGSVVTDGGANIIPPRDQIVSYSSASGGTIYLTVAPRTGGSATLTFTPNNGGTLIQDGATPVANCFAKLNYHGDPHEWGAYGNGQSSSPTDDSVALQSWLAGPGPWDATIPATYDTYHPLTCWPNTNLRAPANDSRESDISPIVSIQADPTPGNFTGTGTGAAGSAAVLTADDQCRISGLSIDASNLSNPATPFFLDAVNVAGTGVVIDSHAILQRGYYNLYCNVGAGSAGMQIKDSQFNKSYSDNIHIGACANDRLIGNVVAYAGILAGQTAQSFSQAGIYFSGDEMTLMGGVIEQSNGIGLDLDTASQVSVTGMYLDSSGEYDLNSAGIEIDNVKTASICGNHFKQNDLSYTATGAHIRFGVSPESLSGASNNVTLCGNVYLDYNQAPQYVYDATPSTAVTLANTSLYEDPQSQYAGVFSPTALSEILPYLQVSPAFSNNHITGLTVSNDSLHADRVDITAGQAADSTNSTIITLPAASGTPVACYVGFNQPDGLNGLDTGTAVGNTTYFYYLVSQPGGAAPSCIASASPTSPTLPSGYTLFRMVAALYTQPGVNHVVQFVQSDDTFTLNTSVGMTTAGSVGSNTPVTISSVPALVSVQAFGRCAANSAVTLSGGNVTPQIPSSTYTTLPGYMVNSSTPNTPFPFALYTLPATGTAPVAPGGTINAASTGSANLTCYNDGWIWHRGK